MKSFFEDIFRYHHHFNRLLITELETYQHRLPQRTFPLFCHLLNAGQIWNSRILPAPVFPLNEIHSFETCGHLNDTIYETALEILNSIQLDTMITYRNLQGNEFSNTVRDILFHATNHATHHKGQMISDFRAAGINPLVTDYIFYVRSLPAGV